MYNKKITITGAGGFIGSVLVSELLKSPCNLIRVSRKTLLPLLGCEDIKADIQKLSTWIKIVESSDIIYHLAGNTSAYYANNYPASSLRSTLLPLNLLIQASKRLNKKPKVVFASTATIYGDTSRLSVNEMFEPNPETVYDLHKLFFEKQLALASDQNILNGISLRLSNVYGPSLSISNSQDRGILNKIAVMAMQRKDITLYGDGNYLRDYIYIDDAVNAFIKVGLSRDQISGVFNVSSGVSVSLKDAFSLIADYASILTKSKINIKHAPLPNNFNSIELRNYIADVSKIKKIFGWKSKIDLEAGIKYMLDNNKKSFV